MTPAYPRRALGDLLVADFDPVEVDAAARYRIAGVLGFGRGVFEREQITGVDTKYTRLFRLHQGTLIYSKLKAFEGAIAVVGEKEAGAFVSQEFPTFRTTPNLDTGYLAHICRWDSFWEALAEHSRGVGARRERLHQDDLLATEIPLPDIEDQRRIAAHLDCVAGIVNHLEDRLARQDLHPAATLLPGLVDQVFEIASEERVEVGALYEVVSDVVHPGDPYEGAECFIGLQHIESHTGLCLGSDPLGDEKGRKFRFQPGDVVYGYLRPYLNKVWVADRVGLCSVDQYVLRPKEGVEPRLLAYVLRSGSTLAQAEQLTHNLQLPRLRTKLLKGIVGADPRSMDAKILFRLDRLTDQMARLARAQARRHRLATAVLPAALNREFAELV